MFVCVLVCILRACVRFFFGVSVCACEYVFLAQVYVLVWVGVFSTFVYVLVCVCFSRRVCVLVCDFCLT